MVKIILKLEKCLNLFNTDLDVFDLRLPSVVLDEIFISILSFMIECVFKLSVLLSPVECAVLTKCCDLSLQTDY